MSKILSPKLSPMEQLAARPMSRLQVQAVGFCLLLVIVDGFDVLAMAFTAQAVSKDWGLSADRVGALLSAGLIGMALGSFFLSPAADRYGRRSAIIACLFVVTLGMAGAAMASDFQTLFLARMATGVGVGAMVSSGTALVFEYSSSRRRALGMGIIGAGFPLGAIGGGSLTLLLVDSYGWRAVFVAGAFASAALIPIFYFLVPESLAHLLASDRPSAARRAATLIDRLGLQPGEASNRTPERRAGLAGPFRGPVRARTLLLSLFCMLAFTTFYFIVSWTPKIAAMAGQPQDIALLSGIMISVGGIAGGLATGLFIPFAGLRISTRLTLGAMAAGTGLMTYLAGSEHILALAVALGFVIYGVTTCLYSLLSSAFPANIRATAIGVVQTSGRIGAAAGPYLGGLAIARGISIEHTGLILAVPAVLAMFLVIRPPDDAL